VELYTRGRWGMGCDLRWGADNERSWVCEKDSCDSVEVKESPLEFSLVLKRDVMVDSWVEIDGDNRLEATDMVDENDMETGLVLGGDEPPNRVDENMSNPLEFGEIE